MALVNYSGIIGLGEDEKDGIMKRYNVA